MSPVIEQEKKVNHILHLILTLVSCGMWMPVWMLVVLSVCLENYGIRKRNGRRYFEQELKANERHAELMSAQRRG